MEHIIRSAFCVRYSGGTYFATSSPAIDTQDEMDGFSSWNQVSYGLKGVITPLILWSVIQTGVASAKRDAMKQ